MKTGQWGEQVARQWLIEQGYRIYACNYRTRYGELDMIAQQGAYLIFAEVKTRKNIRFAYAREHVTEAKQHRLICAAQQWLQQYPTDKQVRFDVIEVYGTPERGQPSIYHIKNAFEE